MGASTDLAGPLCPAKALASLYNVMQTIEGRLGGGEGVCGIYGSITQTGMQRVFDCLRYSTNMDTNSTLVDIGAGLGRPLLHALVEPGVRAGFGIELDPVKVHKARAFMEQTMAEAGRRGAAREGLALPVMQCMPVEEVSTLEPATHAYSFWEGVPHEGKAAFGRLFAACRTLKVRLRPPAVRGGGPQRWWVGGYTCRWLFAMVVKDVAWLQAEAVRLTGTEPAGDRASPLPCKDIFKAVAVVQRSMRKEDPAQAMLELGFGPLLLLSTFSVKMSGSGRSFSAYIFSKIAPASLQTFAKLRNPASSTKPLLAAMVTMLSASPSTSTSVAITTTATMAPAAAASSATAILRTGMDVVGAVVAAAAASPGSGATSGEEAGMHTDVAPWPPPLPERHVHPPDDAATAADRAGCSRRLGVGAEKAPSAGCAPGQGAGALAVTSGSGTADTTGPPTTKSRPAATRLRGDMLPSRATGGTAALTAAGHHLLQTTIPETFPVRRRRNLVGKPAHTGRQKEAKTALIAPLKTAAASVEAKTRGVFGEGLGSWDLVTGGDSRSPPSRCGVTGAQVGIHVWDTYGLGEGGGSLEVAGTLLVRTSARLAAKARARTG